MNPLRLPLSIGSFRGAPLSSKLEINNNIHLFKLFKTNNCSNVASSWIFPFLSGLFSLYCFAVIPNNATFSKSASLA